jgi:hypothetical protein
MIKSHQIPYGGLFRKKGDDRIWQFFKWIPGGIYAGAIGDMPGSNANIKYSDLELIPISPEWLERLGFEVVATFGRRGKQGGKSYSNGKIVFDFFEGEITIDSPREYMNKPFEFVHQAQMVYALFTGEMLEMQQEKTK